jgi:hypothetical protein
MPTLNEDHDRIVARLNLNHIDNAARHAAVDLDIRGAARVELTPGDGTVYRIGIFGKDAPLFRDGELVRGTRDHWVMLMLGRGTAYEWSGDHDLHWSYVADKWADGEMYTGVVLAEFLNRLAALLAPDVDG